MPHTHDEESDLWYFPIREDEHGFTPDVCRTQTLEGRTVNIDWDHFGNPIGIEIL